MLRIKDHKFSLPVDEQTGVVVVIFLKVLMQYFLFGALQIVVIEGDNDISCTIYPAGIRSSVLTFKINCPRIGKPAHAPLSVRDMYASPFDTDLFFDWLWHT